VNARLLAATLGWSAEGVEFDPAVAVARRRGANVIADSVTSSSTCTIL
jgi:hypothetical protein